MLDEVRCDAERGAFLHDWIAGRRPDHIPPEITAIIDRHVRPTLVVVSLFHRMITESKQPPFPTTEIERQLGAGATTPS
ncbi:hypothetical protein ACH41E_25175 [Streptomyces sp. NPDC020412]|uniref:hypothetical protein n=1 Tax=Streptomyces sp. NPDC020412 TaxID=3365073 RepID=UPI0037872FFD